MYPQNVDKARWLMIFAFVISLLCACSEKEKPVAKEPALAPAPAPTALAPAQPMAAPLPPEISPQGIGLYRIGMQASEMLALAGGPYTKEEPYHLALPSEEKVEEIIYKNKAGDEIFTQNGIVCGVRIHGGNARTKEGLGVGSNFGDFEKAYGSASIMAVDDQIAFEGVAQVYDIKVDHMPKEFLQKPAATAKVISFRVTTCTTEPE